MELRTRTADRSNATSLLIAIAGWKEALRQSSIKGREELIEYLDAQAESIGDQEALAPQAVSTDGIEVSEGLAGSAGLHGENSEDA